MKLNNNYFIIDYDKVKFFDQKNSNSCVPIAIIYVIFYLLYIKYDIIIDSSNIVYNYNENNTKLDDNIFNQIIINPFFIYYINQQINNNSSIINIISIINKFDNLKKFYEHNFNNIDSNIFYNYNFDIQFGKNIFYVENDWDLICYYLINNFPLIINIQISDIHTSVIIGFNDITKDLFIINSNSFNTINYNNFNKIVKGIFLINRVNILK
jgi:hypothetical protein